MQRYFTVGGRHVCVRDGIPESAHQGRQSRAGRIRVSLTEATVTVDGEVVVEDGQLAL